MATLRAGPANQGHQRIADLYMLGLSNAAGYMIASDGQLTITLTDQGTLVFK